MNEVTITVSGPVGSGKSALLGEIEIMLKAIGIPLRYADPVAAQSEKNMTHADWQKYLDMYKPSVVLVEASAHPPAQPQLSDEDLTLPQHLLNLIGEYGMARTDGVSELEIQHRWLMLIQGIKDYARSLLARQSGEDKP